MGAEDRRCPRCGSRSLRTVESPDLSNLICTACHRCWEREFGYLIEVNRYACSGCADRKLCTAI